MNRRDDGPNVADPFRAWALANVKRAVPRELKCGHAAAMEFQTCVECAHELGRLEGQVEAGAYYTSDEVFGRPCSAPETA